MFKLKLSPWTFIENVVEDIFLISFYELQINLYIKEILLEILEILLAKQSSSGV